MGSTTPGGVPYPLGTDKVKDGDNAIGTLALALDQDPIEMTAVRNAAASVASNAWVKCAWSGSDSYQHGGNPLLISLGPSGFTVTVAGRYYCEVAVTFPASATAGRRGIGVGTGANPNPFDQCITYCGANVSPWVHGSFTIYLPAATLLTALVYQDTGVAMTIPANSTYMAVRRLRLGQPPA